MASRQANFGQYGERKAVISGDTDDFRILAATDVRMAKGAASSVCRFESSAESGGGSFGMPEHFSGNSRLCSYSQNPSTTKNRSCVVPWTTAIVCAASQERKSGSTTAHCSSFNSRRPAIGAYGGAAEDISRVTPISASTIY